jgi:uncharacterized integral membrane protein
MVILFFSSYPGLVIECTQIYFLSAFILPLFSGQSKTRVPFVQRIGLDMQAMDLLLYVSINDILTKSCRVAEFLYTTGGDMLTLILLIFIIAVVAAFSAQNATPVAVSFLSWRFEASLALVIVLSLLAGIIAGMVLLSWIRLKRSLRQKRASDTDQSKVSQAK